MNIRYDPTVDAAYIVLSEGPAAGFAFTHVCDPAEVKGQIHLDFDLAGRLTGIELIPASRLLPEDLLKRAERLGPRAV